MSVLRKILLKQETVTRKLTELLLKKDGKNQKHREMLQAEQNRLQDSLDGLIKSIEQLESSILLDVDEILSMMLNEI